MHMEAEEEKALWLWERNEWEQRILFSIIPFERMIYASTNWCRTCDNWALASETVQGRHSTSRNSYCSYCTCDSRKTHSQHMYRGWGGGSLEEPRDVKTWEQAERDPRARQKRRNLCCRQLACHSNSSQNGILQHLIKAPLECVSKFLRSRSGRSQQIPRQSQGRKIMTTQEPGRDWLP